MSFTEDKAIFAKVKDISDFRRLDPEQRAEYDEALKRYRDYHLTLETARDEGWQQGRAERDREIKAEMKLNGFEDALIASILHLSLDEISKA